MTLKELLGQIEQKSTALNALLAKDPAGLSVEDAGQIKSLDGEVERLSADAASLRSIEEVRQKASARMALATTAVNPFPGEHENTTLAKADDAGIERVFAVPHRGRVKHFKARKGYGGAPDMSAEEGAARFGYWLTGLLFHRQKSIQWCKDHGVKVLFEGVNERGGLALTG